MPVHSAVNTGIAGLGVNSPHLVNCRFEFGPKLDHGKPRVIHGAGIKAGIYCLSPAHAKQMTALGFDNVTVRSDVRICLSGVASTLAQMQD